MKITPMARPAGGNQAGTYLYIFDSNLDWFGNWVYNIGSVKEKPGRIGRE